ncbi:hypothetical protein GCM10010486_44490 [Nonomuraea roseoviolacea subsp. carminata]
MSAAAQMLSLWSWRTHQGVATGQGRRCCGTRAGASVCGMMEPFLSIRGIEDTQRAARFLADAGPPAACLG